MKTPTEAYKTFLWANNKKKISLFTLEDIENIPSDDSLLSEAFFAANSHYFKSITT